MFGGDIENIYLCIAIKENDLSTTSKKIDLRVCTRVAKWGRL